MNAGKNMYCLVALIALLFTACGSASMESSPTETGNPPINPDQAILTDPNTPATVVFAYTFHLRSALCSKLIDGCSNDIDFAQCMESLADAPNVVVATDYFGTVYTTFKEIEAAEATRVVYTDTMRIDSCITAIHSLSCDAASVQSAADGAMAGDYSRIAGMMMQNSTQCSSLFFSKPVTQGDLQSAPIVDEEF